MKGVTWATRDTRVTEASKEGEGGGEKEEEEEEKKKENVSPQQDNKQTNKQGKIGLLSPWTAKKSNRRTIPFSSKLSHILCAFT